MTTTRSTRRVYLASIQTSFLYHGFFILHEPTTMTPFYYHFIASGEVDVLGAPPLFGIDVTVGTALTHLIMNDGSTDWYVTPDLAGQLQPYVDAPSGSGWAIDSVVMAAGTVLTYFDLRIAAGGFLTVLAHAGPGLEGTLVQQAALLVSGGSLAPVFGDLFWAPSLLQPGEFTISVIGSPELIIDTPGGIPRYGAIEIANGDARHDDLLRDVCLPGHEFLLYDGRDNAAFPDFTLRFAATVRSAEWDLDSIRLILADRQRGLNVPLQQNLYMGTGGLEGGPDLEGRGKPITIGLVQNRAPVLVDLAGGAPIYQVHDGLTTSIFVFDAAIRLTWAGDVTTLALASLYAWLPVGGEYVTDLTNGTFRLGVPPVGVLTVDVHTEPNTTVEAIRAVAVERGGLLDPDQIDVDAFDSHATFDYFMGLYYADGTGVRVVDVLNELAHTSGIFWWFTETGQLSIRAYGSPLNNLSTTPIADQDVLAFRKLPNPTVYWQVRVGYARVGVVQTLNEIETLAEDSRKLLISKEYRYVTRSNEGIRTTCPDAQVLEWNTALAVAVHAGTVADRLLAMLGHDQGLYELELANHQFLHQPGEKNPLALSRYGLVSASVDAPQIVEMTENLLEETTRVILWG